MWLHPSGGVSYSKIITIIFLSHAEMQLTFAYFAG